MITKYEQYYNKIKEIILQIKDEQGYANNSLAFNHWYLKSMYDLSEQEIAENIVDGRDDFGIDSIICDEHNNELTVFQFKFPGQTDQFNKEIGQDEILKTLNGFEILTGRSGIEGGNTRFEEYKERLRGIFIKKFKLVFVSYNSGIISNKNIIESFQENFKQETGSELEVEYVDKVIISNLFEKMTRTTTVSATIPYKFCQQAYNTDYINSYVGVLDAVQLIKSIEDKMLTIFDENIRLLETNSPINEQIKLTGSDEASADMFYFYNNGIVFICDKAQNSPNSLKLSLEGASIVNGCQTVNSLAEIYSDGKLKADVSLLFRVIEIADYDERSRITSFLNSQNSIKGSYFIANHSIVRDLQEDLLKQGYYLERQKNERHYKTTFGEDISQSLVSIKLEDMIQYYAGYWLDGLAAVAKRGKGALFEPNNIDEILKNINAEKVKKAFDLYQDISKVITLYRKVRRNENNDEFSKYINLEQDDLLNSIDEFLFMNTADILLLNISKNLGNEWEENNIEFTERELIVNSIYLSREVLKKYSESPASLTKKNEIFLEIREVAKSWDKESI